MKKRIIVIISISLVVILIAPLIGLIVTGYEIGWGPFSYLQWYNNECYQLSKEEYTYKIIDKEIQGKNGLLKGKLYLVDREDKQPVVVISHGLNTTMIQNHTTCMSLAASGISSFSFDYCGGATNSTSDMSTKDMSILTERSDLNDVIDQVKTWDEIDSSKISIAGYSQGGLVAAITAAERDDIYKLNLVYPAFMMYYEIKMRYPTVDLIPEEQIRNGLLSGEAYYKDIVEFESESIESYCAAYTGKTLFIHGTEDMAVYYGYSVRANQIYTNSELVTIIGAGHGFSGEALKTCLKAQYDFFKEE